MANVLVIDDSLTIRTLVRIALTKAGHEVELAETGREGIDAALGKPHDLILLDFMLPDMKGHEVCTALNDSDGFTTPVVIMSAKNESVKEKFSHYPYLAGYIAKPFTGAQINQAVDENINIESAPATPAEAPAPAAAPPPPAEQFTFEDKERVARMLFGKLKSKLARIPDWLPHMGKASPAAFFARKLLTPELIDDLLTELTPFFERVLDYKSAERAARQRIALEGQLSLMPVSGLLKVLAAYGRSGVLSLHQRNAALEVFHIGGNACMVTTHDAAFYGQGIEIPLSGHAEALLKAAHEQQRTDGKPFPITLAERGLIPASELTALLFERSMELLIEAASAPEGRFVWRETEDIPLYATVYGRPVSPEQLVLEQLRRRADSSYTQLSISDLNMTFERAPGFTHRLRAYDLLLDERRVLGCVDGHTTVEQIARRLSIQPLEVAEVLRRLEKVALVRRTIGVALSMDDEAPSTYVALLEPDRDGFVDSLEALLRSRRPPTELVSIEDPGRWNEVLADRVPSLFVVNASRWGEQALALARGVRDTLEVSDVPMIAVLEDKNDIKHRVLTEAGFNAIHCKPVAFAQIERFLS